MTPEENYQLVHSYFYRESPDTKNRITEICKYEIIEFSKAMSSTLNILDAYNTPQSDTADPKYHAWLLINKATTTLMAAFELALNGYTNEPHILTRSVLELLAVSYDIMTNSERFSAYIANDKFDSKKSIKPFKEVHPYLGHAFGHLSTYFSHVKSDRGFPSITIKDGKPRQQIFGYLAPGEERNRHTDIYNIINWCIILLTTTDIIFMNGIHVDTIISTHQPFIEKMVEVVQKKIDSVENTSDTEPVD